jgi:hypothetical protein
MKESLEIDCGGGLSVSSQSGNAIDPTSTSLLFYIAPKLTSIIGPTVCQNQITEHYAYAVTATSVLPGPIPSIQYHPDFVSPCVKQTALDFHCAPADTSKP